MAHATTRISAVSALVIATLAASLPASPAAGLPDLSSVSACGVAEVEAVLGRCSAWTAQHNGLANKRDEAVAVAASPDGQRIFVSGGVDGSGSTGETAAYDAAVGVELWRTATGASSAVAVSPDGARVYIAGDVPGSGGGNWKVVALSATLGTVEWEATYDGPAAEADTPRAITASPDGSRVFVAGASRGADGTSDAAAAAFDAATGALQWAFRYDHDGGAHTARGVATSPDGAVVYIAASGGVHPDHDVATVALDAATGDVQWLVRHGSPAQHLDLADAIAVSPDGSRVYVTGRSDTAPGVADFGTLAHDAATGDILWYERYDNGGTDLPRRIAATADAVFVTGSSGGVGDFVTLAYDAATGSERWVAREGAGAGAGRAVGVAPDGARVFVAGYVDSGASWDVRVASYDASTGAAAWRANHDGFGSGTDNAHDLTVSPAGARVFVVGSTEGLATNHDWWVAAYDAEDSASLLGISPTP